MDTLTRRPDNPGDPQVITPYFARRAVRRAVLEAVASERARRLALTPAA